jgi:hypothetical protein
MLHATGDWWRFGYLVVPFRSYGTPLLGCLLAWTLVLALSFFFSPLLWVLSFDEIWQGFITKQIG